MHAHNLGCGNGLSPPSHPPPGQTSQSSSLSLTPKRTLSRSTWHGVDPTRSWSGMCESHTITRIHSLLMFASLGGLGHSLFATPGRGMHDVNFHDWLTR